MQQQKRHMSHAEKAGFPHASASVRAATRDLYRLVEAARHDEIGLCGMVPVVA